MIKAFDRQNLQTLRADMESALIAVAQKHNIKIQVGNARFLAENATFKVELSTKSSDGVVNTKTVTDFKRYCGSYGLKPEHLGATFSYLGEKYRLDGMAGGRSYKYVFLATRLSDGKQYRVPESYVAELKDPNHKKLFASAPSTAPLGTCSNTSAYDEKFNPIGQCTRQATTRRKEGFGRTAEMKPFCQRCADLIDESRREMEAERE